MLLTLTYEYDTLRIQLEAIVNEAVLNLDSLLGYMTSPARFLPGLTVPFCRAGLSSIRQLLVTNKLELPLLHRWSHPARPVLVGVHRIHSWVGRLITFLSCNPQSTFQYYRSWSSGKSLPGEQQLGSSSPKVWCLQQQDFIFKFWEATRGNSNSLWFLLLVGGSRALP